MSKREEVIALLTDWLSQDPRVRALWLGGSLGRKAGDTFSDIDFYVAVDEVDFESFYGGIPEAIAQRLPILHVVDFAFRRHSPTERVWFIYAQGLPIHWRIDFHVHTVASARGADPDHRRELIQREFTVMKDPDNLLGALPPLPAPSADEVRSHLQEKVDYLAMVFALMSGYIARGRFWEATTYLASMHDRILYLAALAADPRAMGDGYPRRLKQAADPEWVQRLQAIRFGPDPESQAAGALALIGLFREAAAAAGVTYPEAYMAEVGRVYRGICGD